MARTFIGEEGQYEIDDSGSIVQKMVDKLGKLTGSIRKYKNARNITNPFDREGVKRVLDMLKIYKISGRC